MCWQIFLWPTNCANIPFTNLPSLTVLGGTSFLVSRAPLALGSDPSSGVCPSASWVSLGASVVESAGTSSDEDTPFSKEIHKLTNWIAYDRVNTVPGELQFCQPFQKSLSRTNCTSISSQDWKPASYKYNTLLHINPQAAQTKDLQQDVILQVRKRSSASTFLPNNCFKNGAF